MNQCRSQNAECRTKKISTSGDAPVQCATMEQAAPLHSKLLTDAARQVLRPMGLTQKGRSRTWLDDHGWWVCVVEFQPSSWSRGSYLNVGCMWLWNVKDYISFDEGNRVESLTTFQDERQFQSESDRLARRAAAEVNRYRSLFPSVNAVASYYISHPTTVFWPSFHAGIACAVAGRVEESRAFLRNVTETKDENAWVMAAQSEAAQISAMAHKRTQVKEIVMERVTQTRAMQKLPATAIDFA
jgi:hypothetical protein